jgi:hypothetical protein
MAMTPLEREDPAAGRVEALRAELLDFAGQFREEAALLDTLELADTVAAVEELATAVEYLQLGPWHVRCQGPERRSSFTVLRKSAFRKTIFWKPAECAVTVASDG